MIKLFKDSIDKFQSILPLPYLKQGILTNEAFFMYAYAKLFNIDVVIDSGTHFGRSAEFFAKLGFIVHTLDRNITDHTNRRLSKYDNVVMHVGEDHDIIPQLLDNMNKSLRVAVFMDSTKGRSACIFCKELTAQFKSINMVAIHDQWRQHLMKRYFPKTKCSDEEPFNSKYWYLNKQVFSRKYYSETNEAELDYVKAKYAKDLDAKDKSWSDFKGFVVGVSPT